MTPKPVLVCAIAALLCPASFAQKAATPSKTDRPKRTDAVTPRPAAITPRPAPITPRPAAVTPRPASATPAPIAPSTPASGKSDTSSGDKGSAEPAKPGEEDKDKVPEKKPKGPTIITSVSATYDQRGNVAVFIENVVVVDPEFNVHCDKLTAYLKHDDTPKPAPATPGKPAGKPTGKPGATPATTPAATPAATPDPKAGADAGGSADTKLEATLPPKKSKGLERAIAEAAPGNRVLIIQDKLEADGTVTHGIGRADRADYDAVTGDVNLYGSPEVFQGPKSVVAIDPAAVITLNRDGHMRTKGMTKTTIDNAADDR